MRSMEDPRDAGWQPLPTPDETLAQPESPWRHRQRERWDELNEQRLARRERRSHHVGGWLLALGLGAGVALLAVASFNDPRSLGTQIDQTLASVRGLGDRAGQGLAESRDAAAEASRSAVDGVSTALSDAAISTQVKTALAADPALSAARIAVTTAQGVVRLEGPAPDPAARERATVLAGAPQGVRAVDNRLALPQPGQVVAVADGAPAGAASVAGR